MHIQLTSLLRKGTFLLLWKSSDFISEWVYCASIFFFFFKKHKVHLMYLEVAVGESGTTDGAWISLCHWLFYRKKSSFSQQNCFFIPFEYGIGNLVVSKGEYKNCKPKVVLCIEGKFIEIIISEYERDFVSSILWNNTSSSNGLEF